MREQEAGIMIEAGLCASDLYGSLDDIDSYSEIFKILRFKWL